VIYDGKLIGVTTFGISCSNPAVPDVHTNIHKNIEYLNKIMKE
jgi:secreted trypsin-like serine protease